METNKHNIKESILESIRARKIGMHSKSYFYARVAALVVVSCLVLLISIFILNFLLFSVRINSQDVFLSFGPRGWSAFLAFFPWELLAIDAVLVGVLLALLRQFKFGYKSPLLYMLGGLIALTLVAGFAIDSTTGINEHFLRQADEHRLPGAFGDFYGHARRPPPPGSGFCRHCTIVAIEGNVLTVEEVRSEGTTTRVIVLPPNDPNATTSMLKVGDIIFVAGDTASDGNIRAFGVRAFSPVK